MMGLPDCRRVSYELSREFSDSGTQPRKLSVRLHLMMCGACKRYERTLAWLHRNMLHSTSAAGTSLSDDQRQKIKEAWREDL